MPAYGNEPETPGWRRDVIWAGIILLLAFFSGYLSETSQQRVAGALQGTVLRPFISTQEWLAEARLRATQTELLTTQLDSLSAIVATQSALVDENRTLRSLLDLGERTEQAYLPATVLRPGTAGSESMFLVDVGSSDGVDAGSPVVSPQGLVGVIREVRLENSVGMDWSHPDFRASAMLVDGTSYGLVETRRGRFREEDRMILNGVAYNQSISAGATVVTSGLGGLPRGIPIGRLDGIADAEGSWRKSYWLAPMVEPGSVTHVLILTDGTERDVSTIWPADTGDAPEGVGPGEPGS